MGLNIFTVSAKMSLELLWLLLLELLLLLLLLLYAFHPVFIWGCEAPPYKQVVKEAPNLLNPTGASTLGAAPCWIQQVAYPCHLLDSGGHIYTTFTY